MGLLFDPNFGDFVETQCIASLRMHYKIIDNTIIAMDEGLDSCFRRNDVRGRIMCIKDRQV